MKRFSHGHVLGAAAAVAFVGVATHPLSAESVTVDGGAFIEGDSIVHQIPISGIGPFDPVRTIQLRLADLQHPFAEGLEIFLAPPRSSYVSIVNDLMYNVLTPDGFLTSDIGFDGTYTFEAGTFDEKSIFQQFQETFEAGEDVLPSGTYAPSRGPLIEESTLINGPNLVANNKNGNWSVLFLDEEGDGVGSVGSITLAINEFLPAVEPSDPSAPDPIDPVDPGPGPQPIPTPAALPAGLLLLGALGLRRSRRHAA